MAAKLFTVSLCSAGILSKYNVNIQLLSAGLRRKTGHLPKTAPGAAGGTVAAARSGGNAHAGAGAAHLPLRRRGHHRV